MEQTNIEHFNSYLKLFITNIKNSFEEYSPTIDKYYKELLESETCNDDKYVKRYTTKMKKYKTQVSKKDDSIFNNDIYIFKNINFKDIWISGELSENNKEKIWEYLQTLFILSETILNDANTIKNLIKSFKKINNQNLEPGNDAEDSTNPATDNDTEDSTKPEPVNDTDDSTNPATDNDAEDSTKPDDDDLINMIKNLSSDKSDKSKIDEKFIEEGLIGKLANELTEELSLDDMDLNLKDSKNVNDIFSNLMSGDNSLKFMNLIQTVGHKIQNKVQKGEFDQSDLFSEAKKVMSTLQDKNNIFEQLMKTENETPRNKTHERLKNKIKKKNKD